MSAPEVAGLREALRDVAEAFHRTHGGLWDQCTWKPCERARAALRDRAGVPPPPDRAGSGVVAAESEGKTEQLAEERVRGDAHRDAAGWWLEQYKVVAEALRKAHACATLRDDGTCDGCFVSEALQDARAAGARPAPVPLARAPLDRAGLGGVPASEENG